MKTAGFHPWENVPRTFSTGSEVGPYTAMVLFSAGLVASNVVRNTILMRKPVWANRSIRRHTSGARPVSSSGAWPAA